MGATWNDNLHKIIQCLDVDLQRTNTNPGSQVREGDGNQRFILHQGFPRDEVLFLELNLSCTCNKRVGERTGHKHVYPGVSIVHLLPGGSYIMLKDKVPTGGFEPFVSTLALPPMHVQDPWLNQPWLELVNECSDRTLGLNGIPNGSMINV